MFVASRLISALATFFITAHNLKRAMKNDAKQAAIRAERKAQLLITSAAYRTGILHGHMTVVQCLQTKSLVESAFEHVVGLLGARLGTLASGVGVKSLMPLAAVSFSYLSSKRLVKPAIGAGLILATVIALFWRHKHSEAVEIASLPPE